MLELLSGNRKDQCEKTRLLLCARFLHVKIPSPYHTLLLPLQDQDKGSLRGSKGPYTHSSPPSSPKQGSHGECWLLLPEGGMQGFCQRHLWLQAASGMGSAQTPSHITPLHRGHVWQVCDCCQCTSDSTIEVAMAGAGPSKSHLKWDLT